MVVEFVIMNSAFLLVTAAVNDQQAAISAEFQRFRNVVFSAADSEGSHVTAPFFASITADIVQEAPQPQEARM